MKYQAICLILFFVMNFHLTASDEPCDKNGLTKIIRQEMKRMLNFLTIVSKIEEISGFVIAGRADDFPDEGVSDCFEVAWLNVRLRDFSILTKEELIRDLTEINKFVDAKASLDELQSTLIMTYTKILSTDFEY